MQKLLAPTLFACVCIVLIMYTGERSRNTSVAELTPVPLPQYTGPDPVHEKLCNNRLAKLNTTTATWDRWERHGDTISVWVWPRFYMANLYQQRTIDSLFRCAASAGAKDDPNLKHVNYLEIYTDKNIAQWSRASGFRMLQ